MITLPNSLSKHIKGRLDPPMSDVCLSVCLSRKMITLPNGPTIQSRPILLQMIIGGFGHWQMIIWRDRPLANDHLEDLASCKWSYGGTGLFQMIFRHPSHPNHLSQDLDSILRTFLERFALVFGPKAFDPVFKGPPYEILVFLKNCNLAKRDNFQAHIGKSHIFQHARVRVFAPLHTNTW